jgi:hypothetical protein
VAPRRSRWAKAPPAVHVERRERVGSMPRSLVRAGRAGIRCSQHLSLRPVA